MTPEQKEVFAKRVVRLDYKPPTPFFFGVDFDGLVCWERELLAQGNQCCPKCSNREWIHDGSIIMKCTQCAYLTTIHRLRTETYSPPSFDDDDEYDPEDA